MFHVPEKYRWLEGPMASDSSDGNNGCFIIGDMRIIASEGMGWEHVSLSFRSHTPTWDDMCFVKGLFWDSGDCVVQFHPPESEYVNNHPHCLHLWRQVGKDFPMPDSILVGVKRMAGLRGFK